MGNHNPPPTKLEPAPHLHSKIKFPHATTLLSNSNTFKSISPHTETMAREGTRQATGNSKPRIFPTVAETTTTKRATANTGAKRGPKKATATKASKPVGVKKAAPAKKTSVATNPAKKAAGTKKIKGNDGAKPKTKVVATKK